MGTKYTTTAVVGYNSTPPADDGTVSDANKLKWSTIKTKLPDPLNTAIAAMDTKLVDYVNVGPVAKTTTYTTVAGDHNKTLECSGTFTVSLMDASSAGAGYTVEINNQGTGTITVGRITAGNTINTVASNVTLAPKVSMTFRVIAAANGYAIIATGRDFLNVANTFATGQVVGTGSGNVYLSIDGGAASDRTLFFKTAGVARLAVFLNSTAESGSNAGSDLGITTYADDGGLLATNAVSMRRSDGSVNVGSPTGGFKGAGTINAVGVYDDNVLLTCYVMAAEKGDLTLDKWDAATPDLHIPERRHEKDGEVAVIPEINETRVHEPARKFFARADELLDPKKYAKAWKKDGHLPTMPSPTEWEESGKKMTLGALVQKLWETVEVQAVHISKLEARISSLGG